MLSPYRVLDLSDERGLFCSHILSDLGAEVIHVEPPNGSPARHSAPFAGDVPDPERSLTWWAMARDSKSVVIDLDSEPGRHEFLSLVASADIVIESDDPGAWQVRGFGHDELAAANPRLVTVAITAFGSTGPKADYAATDLIVQAASGVMAMTGSPDRRPLRAASVVAYTHAAAEAAGGALIALRHAQRTGRGQRVEVSAQRATNLTTQFMLPAASIGARPITRSGGFNLFGIDFPLIWACADGYVSMTVAIDPVNQPFLERLLRFMEDEGHAAAGITDRDWVAHLRAVKAGDAQREDFILIRDAVAEFVSTRTKGDLLAAALDRKLLIVPVATFADLLASEHFSFRSFWVEEELPDGTAALLPGHLTKSTRPTAARRSPAPSLGADTEAVLQAPRATPGSNALQANSTEQDAPLAGVNVLDLMWVLAGPMSTGAMAQFGANVVRVENEARLDTARLLTPWYGGKVGKETSLGFASVNVNKRSVTIDPNTDEGKQVLLELVEWADIVTESFSPRAMRRWGLDYENLRKIKPDIIMLSSCLMGQDGPQAFIAGYGTMGAAAAGLSQPTGWPDRPPLGPYGAYTDYCAPRITIATLLAALDHRDRTGEGQYFDQSQIESSLSYITPALLDHQVNGTDWDRLANTDPTMFPHDVYPCGEGVDPWVAIACRTNDDWASICEVIGRDDLAALDLDARRAAAVEIDAAIAAWAQTRTPERAEHALQAVGVPAHAVHHTESPPCPQLDHLNHMVMADHIEHGLRPIERTRIDLSDTPAVITATPKLGQHTDEVMTEILGYDSKRIAQLRAAGALGTGRKR